MAVQDHTLRSGRGSLQAVCLTLWMPLDKLSFNIIFWMTTLCPNLCQALQGQEQQYDPWSQVQSSPSKWEGITGKTRSQTHKTTDYKGQSYKTSDLLLKKKKGHRLGALIIDLARLWLFSFVLCIYFIYTWLCLMKQALLHILGERWKGPDKSLDWAKEDPWQSIGLAFPQYRPFAFTYFFLHEVPNFLSWQTDISFKAKRIPLSL